MTHDEHEIMRQSMIEHRKRKFDVRLIPTDGDWILDVDWETIADKLMSEAR